MASFELPEKPAGVQPAFQGAEGARDWLAGQPLAAADQLELLLAQIQAVDASPLAPAERFACLDVLRGAVLRCQGILEARYTRKALPPSQDSADAMALSLALWRALAVAYLRPIPLLSPVDALVPLHRAAVALRLEHFAHLLAGYEVPAHLQRLLYGVLGTAESLGVQRTPLSDPDLTFLGESHIAGHIAWALLLQAVDPYRLSAAQLAVANRACSRWRELAGFQSEPDDDPKARTLLLSRLLPGVELAEGGPRRLEVRAVVRKIRKRIESLEAGETPESLKLGRELSGEGCIALLRKMDFALKDRPAASGEPQPVQLAFGPANAYVAIERRPLNPSGMDASSERHSHERMAVFGFDNVSNLAGSVSRAEFVTESWQMLGDRLVRLPSTVTRHLAPCLVALAADKPEDVHLGVLNGLRMTEDGCLYGRVLWFFEQPLAARIRMGGPLAAKAARIPAFLLPEAEAGQYSLIVPPTAGIRPHTGVALDDSPVEHLLVAGVIDRGSDFVRYACRAN